MHSTTPHPAAAASERAHPPRKRTSLLGDHAPQRRWRDPNQVLAQWAGAALVDRVLLESRAIGDWWDHLEQSNTTVLVGREYEHMVIALSMWKGSPHVSYLPLPHPSGIAVDATNHRISIASTRNPNQIFHLTPVTSLLPLHRLHPEPDLAAYRPLVPRQTEVFPGSLYLHDLALLDGRLIGTAVGRNTIVSLDRLPSCDDIWWPNSIHRGGEPLTDRNYIQLNSIAAGTTLDDSYFTASCPQPGVRRPGHHNFPVNRRGVVFSGASREPAVLGLTRPHSARFWRGSLLVANSGYGELVATGPGRSDYDVICRLPGWTRGLGVVDGTALVATSRILPGFERYAPGIDPVRAVCGIHAIDLSSGSTVGSLIWPHGDQVFAVETIPRAESSGFLLSPSPPRLFDTTGVLYGFSPRP